jgi:hypothetical protein
LITNLPPQSLISSKVFDGINLLNGISNAKELDLIESHFGTIRNDIKLDAEIEETVEIIKNKPYDSEWKLVDRAKVKKVKTLEELAKRPPSPEEDGTVWKEAELHETCWEERN